jgi:hypothetical protein
MVRYSDRAASTPPPQKLFTILERFVEFADRRKSRQRHGSEDGRWDPNHKAERAALVSAYGRQCGGHRLRKSPSSVGWPAASGGSVFISVREHDCAADGRWRPMEGGGARREGGASRKVSAVDALAPPPKSQSVDTPNRSAIARATSRTRSAATRWCAPRRAARTPPVVCVRVQTPRHSGIRVRNAARALAPHAPYRQCSKVT